MGLLTPIGVMEAPERSVAFLLEGAYTPSISNHGNLQSPLLVRYVTHPPSVQESMRFQDLMHDFSKHAYTILVGISEPEGVKTWSMSQHGGNYTAYQLFTPMGLLTPDCGHGSSWNKCSNDLQSQPSLDQARLPIPKIKVKLFNQDSSDRHTNRRTLPSTFSPMLCDRLKFIAEGG